MNCTGAQTLFNQYLDGELSPIERSNLEDHLAACTSCSGSVENLRELLAYAGELTSMIPPRTDLWPGIRNQIEEKMARSYARRAGFRRLGWHARPLVTVSAAFLIITLSVVALRLYSDGINTVDGHLVDWNRGLVTLAAMEKQYMGVAEDLISSIRGYEGNLPESARVTIEENLELIDVAIHDSRLALLNNPSDAELQSMLSANYRRKVELLQWTAQLTTQL
jgi:hypothetical protein